MMRKELEKALWPYCIQECGNCAQSSYFISELLDIDALEKRAIVLPLTVEHIQLRDGSKRTVGENEDIEVYLGGHQGKAGESLVIILPRGE